MTASNNTISNSSPSNSSSSNSTLAAATLKLIDNAEEWRRILAELPDPHVLQSWEWGEIKSQNGWTPKRYAISDGSERLVGAFLLLLRRAPARLPFSIGYLPKGPVLDWSDAAIVDVALEFVQQAARRGRCLFIKIDPNVLEDGADGVVLTGKLRQRGWSFSDEQIQFKNTAYSGLESNSPSADDALLAQMKSKWRYNIRLAERRGVEIREAGVGDFERFYALYADTGSRDGFAIRPFSYYQTVWQSYLAAQQEADNPAGGVLFLAEHPEEEQPIAGLFLMRYEETVWYFYGASSERRRRDMPNYLLQWQALRWSVELGATLYDWWGGPTNPDDPEDGMGGVWRFKQGFGAELQVHVGAWDWSPFPLLFLLYKRLLPLMAKIVRR